LNELSKIHPKGFFAKVPSENDVDLNDGIDLKLDQMEKDSTNGPLLENGRSICLDFFGDEFFELV